MDDYYPTFIIVPYGGEDFKNKVIQARQGIQGPLDEWNTITEKIVSNSLSISEYLPGYSIAMLDPTNTDDTMFTVKDGIVWNDAVKGD